MNVIEQLRLGEQDQKIDQILRLVMKHERDIATLRAELQQLRDDLPDIIAKAVAPLLRG